MGFSWVGVAARRRRGLYAQTLPRAGVRFDKLTAGGELVEPQVGKPGFLIFSSQNSEVFYGCSA